MKKIIRLDSQILNRVCECPRKTGFSYVAGYGPPVLDTDLSIGSLAHVGLEVHYKELKKKELTYDQITEKAISVMRSEVLISDISVNDSELVIKTYLDYAAYRKGESLIPLEIEQPFSKVLFENDNFTILYEGVIDLVFSDINIPLGIADHKKMKQDRQISLASNQFKGYVWATGINFVIVNKFGFQKTLPPEKKFGRAMLSYPKCLIDEWVRTAVYHAMRYATYLELSEFPPNFNACDLYKGCMFRSVCTSDPEVRIQLLNAEFRINKIWDPFSKRKMKED